MESISDPQLCWTINCWTGVEAYVVRGTFEATERGTFDYVPRDPSRQAYLAHARRKLILLLESLPGTTGWNDRTRYAYRRLTRIENERELAIFEWSRILGLESDRGVSAGSITDSDSGDENRILKT